MTDKCHVVAFLTDFGTEDPYVGVMKGVLLGLAPAAVPVDLTHAIPPQDVRLARRVLAASARYFPGGTIFVAVVDPGVGTARRALAARTGGCIYLAPDNGLLTFLVGAEIRAIDARRWGLPAPSATFDGRDVFAPVAGHLLRGVPFTALGPEVERLEPGPPDPGVRRAPGRLKALVVARDRFGNLITNVHASDLATLGGPAAVEVRLGRRNLGPVRRTYAEVPSGAPLTLLGSFGELEIAVRDGDAARTLRAGPGATVSIVARKGKRP